MHILFLTDNFPPEVNAPASRTHEHCREWVQAGHRVTVITCAPNFPGGRVFAGYRNCLWQEETISGIRVIRVWTYITRNEGFAKRILDYLSFMVTSFLAALFVRKVDVVIGTSPQFFTACGAFAIALCKQRPWIFELRDIWPESIRAVSQMKSGRLLDLLEKLELFLYRRSNAIVAVTNAFKANLVRRGIEANKIYVVTNGADVGRFTPMPKDQALVEQLSLLGKLTIGYIGTHGMAHALETIIEAARILDQQQNSANVHFLMLGDGAERQDLVSLANRYALTNVTFLESVSKDEIAAYWSILDIAIVHLKKNELFKTVIPSKIFEAMAMGIPILHGVEGESAEIVKSAEIGWTFEPENAQQLAFIIAELAMAPHVRQAAAEKGPTAAARFDRRNLAASMLRIIERVARLRPI